jgi:hypothetical protein
MALSHTNAAFEGRCQCGSLVVNQGVTDTLMKHLVERDTARTLVRAPNGQVDVCSSFANACSALLTQVGVVVRVSLCACVRSPIRGSMYTATQTHRYSPTHAPQISCPVGLRDTEGCSSAFDPSSFDGKCQCGQLDATQSIITEIVAKTAGSNVPKAVVRTTRLA